MKLDGLSEINETIVHIEWQSPVTLSDTENWSDKAHKGLYAVYGNHTVYGKDTLLYIGKTVEQTFSARLLQSNWKYNSHADSLRFHFGLISDHRPAPSLEIWDRVISLCEILLIYSHAPACNSHYISEIPKKHRDNIKNIHIFNWGYHRDLMPEVSGQRWSGVHDNSLTWQNFSENL